MVLPLVVQIERASPPRRTDALEAAAMAVLGLLADPGEWAGEVDAWESSGKIRKVVRRARGAEWARVLALPGRTVTHGSAEVRVHPPVPLDDWPRDLARLQVSGTHLEDAASAEDVAGARDIGSARRVSSAGEAASPASPAGDAASLVSPVGGGASAVVLWENPALEMSAGKAMAQAGHAAQLAWWATSEPDREAWAARGLAVAVRRAVDFERLAASGLPVVRDAGYTEIAPGSATFVADAPWLRDGSLRVRS